MFMNHTRGFYFGGTLSFDMAKFVTVHTMAFVDNSNVSLQTNEGHYYSIATSVKPNFVESLRPAHGSAAKSLFPNCRFVSRKEFTMNDQCKPEYHGVSQTGRPTYCGEAKSLDTVQLEEMLQYACISMSDAQFSGATFDFYAFPPVCFAILSSGPFGWIASIEWVGCLFYKFISKPFCLGSKEHEDACALINDIATTIPEYMPV